jgi:hypothetical protein
MEMVITKQFNFFLSQRKEYLPGFLCAFLMLKEKDLWLMSRWLDEGVGASIDLLQL